MARAPDRSANRMFALRRRRSGAATAPALHAAGRRPGSSPEQQSIFKKRQRLGSNAAKHLSNFLDQLHRIGVQQAVGDMSNVRFARRLAQRLQAKGVRPVDVVQCVLFCLRSRRPHLEKLMWTQWPEPGSSGERQLALGVIARTRAAALECSGRCTFWHGPVPLHSGHLCDP